MSCSKTDGVKENAISTPLNIKNKRYFKNYFMQTWCKSNLSHEFYKFIKELNNTDVAFKNKKVVVFMYNKYKTSINIDDYENANTKDLNIEFMKIVDQNTNYYDISLGDVIFVINTIRDKFIDTKTQALVFAIKTMYTLFLEEYLNDWKLDICVKLDNLVNNTEDVHNNIKDNKSSIKFNYPDYLVLIGDCIYNINEYNRVIGLSDYSMKKLVNKVEINPIRYYNTISKIKVEPTYFKKEDRSEIISYIELSYLFLEKRFKLKHRYNKSLSSDDIMFNNTTFNVFSFFSSILNVIFRLIIQETSLNTNLFSNIMQEIVKEKESIICRIIQQIYNGIPKTINNKKIIDIINISNCEIVKNNILEIIDYFSLCNIEIIEKLILSSKIKLFGSLEATSCEFINSLYLNRRIIEDINKHTLKFTNNIFDIEKIDNPNKRYSFEEIFKYLYISPRGTKIDGTISEVYLDKIDKGLYPAVRADFIFPHLWTEDYIYSFYLKCLNDLIKNTHKVSSSEFEKVNINKLYDNIEEGINKYLKQ